MNIKETLRAQREIMATLTEEWPYLMSVDNVERGSTAGAIVQCDRAGAARCLFEKTHRLATREEIQAHVDAEAAVRKAAEDKANAANLFVAGVGSLFRQPDAAPPAADPKAAKK